jgi:hypothetical protein
VVALCRSHHRQYDHGQLKLAPYLDQRWEAELTHARSHVGHQALAVALTGGAWLAAPAKKQGEPPHNG